MVPLEGDLFRAAVDRAINPQAVFEDRVLRNADYTISYGVEYAIRVYGSEGTLRYGKLSKLQMREMHTLTPDDVADVYQEDWPYLDFVADIHPDVQAVVFRMSTAVVRDVQTLERHLEEIARQAGLFEFGYAVSFRPIVDDSEFWSLVHRSQQVFGLSFTLKSPNLFGARMRANEALRATRDQYNNTEVQVRLKNEHGELRLPEEEVESYRDYADRGGGDWELDVRQEGRRRRVKSSSRAVKISIEIPDLSEPVRYLQDALRRFRDLL